MARISPLSRTLSSTIPLARGVADRAVRTAGPVVLRVVGRVASHLRRRPRPQPSTPETFTPSPVADRPVAAVAVPEPPSEPTPSSVARNVAGPRPTAKMPTKRKPRSVPGAKLPVTRPST